VRRTNHDCESYDIRRIYDVDKLVEFGSHIERGSFRDRQL
jgi:hypothetical protein